MRIQLIQTAGGKPLGADPATQKEFVVELVSDLAGYTWSRLAQLVSGEIFLWGSYRVRDSNGNLIAGVSIGRLDKTPSQLKIWGWKPKAQIVIFATIQTDLKNGAGASVPDTLELEMSLNDAYLTGTKVWPMHSKSYAGGYVEYPSRNGAFHQGYIHWGKR